MVLKVFYRPEQSATTNSSYSSSALKPAQTIKSWQDMGLDIRVVSFDPVAIHDICLAHDNDFVADIMALEAPNGFENYLPEVRDTLPYTLGSFVAAALHAARTGEPAVSPTSGFHHAGYAYTRGFCTFNGLMVAAIKLKQMGVQRVGILDLDAHYGDGTDNILRQLGILYVEHYTFGREFFSAPNAQVWLDGLAKVLAENFSDCNVLLYQAGADPHIDDPLGGHLTTDQMRQRDRTVFEFCRRNRLPVAWKLAGGYQIPLRKVLDLHGITAIECLNAHKVRTIYWN